MPVYVLPVFLTGVSSVSLLPRSAHLVPPMLLTRTPCFLPFFRLAYDMTAREANREFNLTCQGKFGGTHCVRKPVRRGHGGRDRVSLCVWAALFVLTVLKGRRVWENRKRSLRGTRGEPVSLGIQEPVVLFLSLCCRIWESTGCLLGFTTLVHGAGWPGTAW